MSSELIKAMEWLSWQLGMMYSLSEHNSTSFDIDGSQSHCSVEYNRHEETVYVEIKKTEQDWDDDADDYIETTTQQVETWEISIDEENEDLLMSEMESILRWIRREM